MVGTRGCLDPHFGEVDIKQAQNIGWQMDKAIIAVAGLGSCSILIVRAKANVDPLFSKFQVFHSHAECLPNTKSALFEQETEQTVTETGKIAVGVLSHMNAIDECLEILF